MTTQTSEATHVSTDQDWAGGNTIVWFELGDETWGVCVNGCDARTLLDDEGYPVDDFDRQDHREVRDAVMPLVDAALAARL